ncbi:MAG TPA: UDP-N-acetylglucosamine 2-epimerase (non-hydrolyzing) [Allosphingosinicella sp.]|nr:UDP-N-acetylglucosamine 2-epimerase (non-hydrolyzing) [Allosphingosinicella sp.]
MAAERRESRFPLVVSIVGTRPEAIKMGPVVRALARCNRLRQRVLLTGQHSGLARHFDVGDEIVRELPFDPRGRSPSRLRETLHQALCGHFQRDRIDLMLVQGDTASALAGAFAARDCGIPIGHVEAGLRSFDLSQPWPEEGNRVAIDALSDLLFAPTETAAENLRRDWRVGGRIEVTGNTGIDALLDTRRRLPRSRVERKRLIVASCHRKENQGERLRSVCAALRHIASALPVEVEVILHPNRHARAAMEAALGEAPGIRRVDALDYQEMVGLLDRSWLLLTDSGGLQEEGPALGKPVLVLRDVTERGEAVATGNIALVGTDADRIFEAVSALFADEARYAAMARPAFPFGDGRAAERIAASVQAWLDARRTRAA